VLNSCTIRAQLDNRAPFVHGLSSVSVRFFNFFVTDQGWFVVASFRQFAFFVVVSLGWCVVATARCRWFAPLGVLLLSLFFSSSSAGSSAC